jgi:hypothetical protein
MSTNALASPMPGDAGWLDGRAWQEANHDETGVNWEPAWRAGVGHPHGVADLPPVPQQAAIGHYGPGYADPQLHWGGATPAATPGWHEDHAHFHRLREEHARSLDEDYAAWRRQRFSDEFERWRARERREPIAPEHESALGSFGRAIAETVSGSGSFEPELPGTRQR